MLINLSTDEEPFCNIYLANYYPYVGNLPASTYMCVPAAELDNYSLTYYYFEYHRHLKQCELMWKRMSSIKK